MTTIWFTSIDSEEKDPEELPFVPFVLGKKHLFGKPKEIGHFSIDSERKIHFDRSQMKYLISNLITENLNLDLNLNFELDLIHNYVTLEKMHQLLYWLIHYNHPENSFKTSDVNFITVRGTLMRVLCTPFLNEKHLGQWEICASKLDNVIYFAAIDTDEEIAKNENPTRKQFLCQSWGYKFEQFLTTDKIGGVPDLSNRTHQFEEFCIVLKNVLNRHSLLYKAEIDAVVPYRYPSPGFGDTSCYTELKTSKIMRGTSQELYFSRFKALQWWAQSYLVGVPEIICGSRTDDGIIKFLKILRVSNLSKESYGLWSPDDCLNFCDKFLNFLKKTVVENDNNIVYKFEYKCGDKISCTRLVNPEKRYKIIPDWYEKSLRNKVS